MPKLWKNGAFITDTFTALDNATPLPAEGAVIVSLDRWRQELSAAAACPTAERVGLAGITCPVTATLDPVGDALGRLALIAIPFAKFSDGRGYSIARRLRDEMHFSGEIRATGEVLLDQIPLLLRCGFDAFAIDHAPTVRALAAGRVPAIPEVYQTSSLGRARSRSLAPAQPLTILAAE
jgi:uncharacterized protein (DUF934 family)